jgi:hypothetical protein
MSGHGQVPGPPEVTSRAELRSEIEFVMKRLKQVLASMSEGESSGLLVARVSEIHEYLGDVVESARMWVADPQGDEAEMIIQGIRGAYADIGFRLNDVADRCGVDRSELAQYIAGNPGPRQIVQAVIEHAGHTLSPKTDADNEEEEEGG